MLKPFDARVMVKKPKREEQTASGIILPDTVSEQAQTAQGIVISVGQGSRNMNTGDYMEIPIKEGDTIIYTKFSAMEVQHEGEDYFFVAERDIIAVIEN
jgi:chaperonin GroES